MPETLLNLALNDTNLFDRSLIENTNVGVFYAIKLVHTISYETVITTDVQVHNFKDKSYKALRGLRDLY